jgi:hypothetical protein
VIRLVLSILGGWFVGASLSIGIDHLFHVTDVYPAYGEPMVDHGLLAVAFSYRAVFTVISCYLAARWAGEKGKSAAWALGILGTITWIVGSIMMWEYAVAWYNILGIVASIPLALWGARLNEISSAKATLRSSAIEES